jgi:hypothetical protein
VNIAWLESPVWVNPAEYACWDNSDQSLDVCGKGRELAPPFTYCSGVTAGHAPPDVVQRVTADAWQPNRFPRVSALLRSGGPADVPLNVGTVVVLPVQGHARGPGSDCSLDVGNEQPDIMPAFAHGDAAGAVDSVAPVLRVIAPGHHLAPGAVELVMCKPVPYRHLFMIPEGTEQDRYPFMTTALDSLEGLVF